jgi:hypothetical protein
VKVISSDGLLPNALMAVDLPNHILFIEREFVSYPNLQVENN